MIHNRLSAAVPTTVRRDTHRFHPRRPTWRARWTARIHAARLDAALAVGASAAPGTALAVRAARLTSRRERELLARALCRAVRDSRDTTAFVAQRVPVHRSNIQAAQAAIEAVVTRLRAPGSIDVRGVARLSRLVVDGTGPLYRYGRGDLAGRLGAALAAM